MSWNLEGCVVEGLYIGKHPVTGTVRNSRVKYGGGVQHSVDLHQPLFLSHGRSRTSVVLSRDNIVRVIQEVAA